MVTINISNKSVYTFIAVIVLIISGAIIFALDPGIAPNPGHTIETIAPPTSCAAGQVLKWSGTAWECGTISGNIICATFSRNRGSSTLTFIGASNGLTYASVDVVELGTYNMGIKCKSPWVMTGCSTTEDGTDEDSNMGINSCNDLNDMNSEDSGYARCCKN